MIYPNNLLMVLYQDSKFNSYLNENNFKEQYPNVCKEAKLNDKYIDVLKLRYEDGLTMQAIGDKYNCTRENIRQVIVKGVAKLQRVINKYTQKDIYMDSPIEDFVLSSRAISILHSHNIYKVGDLLTLNVDELMMGSEKIGLLYINEIKCAILRATYTAKDSELVECDVKKIMENHNLTKDELIEIIKNI